ncbi:MAG: hypothetical protein WCR59_00960 [Planctomycetota bacterium]
MTNPELTIRWYQPGDEHAILKTFNFVFREVCGQDYVDRSAAAWHWAYLQNPAGHRISLAVAADGTVASQYAGMPMRVDTPFGERLFVHCVDSMTHPKWRQGLRAKSLFVETCMPFWAHCKAIGDALFYGLPVDAAFRIGQRYLKYHEMCVVDFVIRDRSLPKLQMPSGIEVEQVLTVPLEVDALYARCRADKQCLLQRDHRYLHWRYVQNPAHQDFEVWTARRSGQLCGVMVLKPNQGLAPDAAMICDWLVPESDTVVLDALLAKATERQQQAGRERLMAVFPQWSHEWHAFIARGFIKTPSANWHQRRLIHNINVPYLTPDFLATSWWFTIGDSDLA